MAQVSVNIRMDQDIKQKAEILFTELGLNMTTAVNAFVRQSIRQGNIPFELTTKIAPVYNEELLAAVADMEAGRGIIRKTMAELEDMENG